MDPFTIGALALQGIGTVAGISAQNRANRTNVRLAREQMQFQREQWQRELNYNSPSQQMLRARAAGINPNAYVQNTPGGSVQFGSAPQVSATDFSGMSDFAGRLQDIPQREYAKQLAAENVTRAKHENFILGIDAEHHLEIVENNIKKQIAELEQSDLDAKYKHEQITDLVERLKMAQGQHDLTMQLNGQQLQNLKSQQAYTDKQTELLEREFTERVRQFNMQNALEWFNAHVAEKATGSQINLNSKQAEQLDEAIRLARNTRNYKVLVSRLQAVSAKLDANQKRLLAKMLEYKLGNVAGTSSSFFGNIIRSGLGVDPSDIVGIGLSSFLK